MKLLLELRALLNDMTITTHVRELFFPGLLLSNFLICTYLNHYKFSYKNLIEFWYFIII
jgi:hypothetical protein